jgi:protein N-terminal asparagine amidohydrolase
MSTAVVELCPLDDVLDPGGAIDHGGLQDKIACADGMSAIDPLQIDTDLYVDTTLCSIQASLSETDPFSYQEERKESSIGETAPPESYVCEWTTTHLRLPPSEEDNQQDQFLCLPVNVTASALSHAQEGSPKEESKGSIDENIAVPKQLRLAALDKYLATVPSLSQHNLFNSNEVACSKEGLHRLITATNSGRIINVIQGEIAHCSPSQADVLVSDDATTCHILALRSICRNSLGKDAVLATMAHVDGKGYESCLRDAVMEHVKYHSRVSPSDPSSEESKENTSPMIHQNHIEISIHMMGGFNDPDGSSIGITDDILQVFSRMAREFHELTLYHAAEKYWEKAPQVSMTLETCVVSAANDDGTCCPIGRGLGLDVASGHVFLAEVEESRTRSSANVVNKTGTELIALDGDLHLLRTGQQMLAEGPEALLRSVRLWAGAFHPSKQERKLIVIHRPDQDYITIQPFMFGPNPSAKFMCYMDDARLLHMTSTSPLVEKSDFAAKVRESLRFMNQTSSSNIFEVVNGMPQPIEYKRVGLNGWIRSK